MPFNIGPGELILILVIALVVLGPGKLPDVASSLGKSIREFCKAASDVSDAGRLDATDKPASPRTDARAGAPAVTGPEPRAESHAVPPPPPMPDAPATASRDGGAPASDPNPS